MQEVANRSAHFLPTTVIEHGSPFLTAASLGELEAIILSSIHTTTTTRRDNDPRPCANLITSGSSFKRVQDSSVGTADHKNIDDGGDAIVDQDALADDETSSELTMKRSEQCQHIEQNQKGLWKLCWWKNDGTHKP